MYISLFNLQNVIIFRCSILPHYLLLLIRVAQHDMTPLLLRLILQHRYVMQGILNRIHFSGRFLRNKVAELFGPNGFDDLCH